MRVYGATWDRLWRGTESYSSRPAIAVGVYGATWDVRGRGLDVASLLGT